MSGAILAEEKVERSVRKRDRACEGEFMSTLFAPPGDHRLRSDDTLQTFVTVLQLDEFLAPETIPGALQEMEAEATRHRRRRLSRRDPRGATQRSHP